MITLLATLGPGLSALRTNLVRLQPKLQKEQGRLGLGLLRRMPSGLQPVCCKGRSRPSPPSVQRELCLCCFPAGRGLSGVTCPVPRVLTGTVTVMTIQTRHTQRSPHCTQRSWGPGLARGREARQSLNLQPASAGSWGDGCNCTTKLYTRVHKQRPLGAAPPLAFINSTPRPLVAYCPGCLGRS